MVANARMCKNLLDEMKGAADDSEKLEILHRGELHLKTLRDMYINNVALKK